MGETLARYNVASVLLPLPEHFCRNILFNINDYDPEDAYKLAGKPVLKLYTDVMKYEALKHPEMFIHCNRQILADIHGLIEAVQDPDIEARGERQRDFFKEHLNPEIAITLMGYSLGGLGALQAYLLEPDVFDACILINSGASFQDMDASSLFGADYWRKLRRGVVRSARDHSDKVKENFYSQAFLGHEKIEMQDLLTQHAHKILVVLGGSDVITNRRTMTNLEPEGTGLAIVQIPGLEHPINKPSKAFPQWQRWSDFAVSTMLAFIQHHPRLP